MSSNSQCSFFKEALETPNDTEYRFLSKAEVEKEIGELNVLLFLYKQSLVLRLPVDRRCFGHQR